MSAPNKVEKNFSKHAKNYSKSASFQQYAATKLMAQINVLTTHRDVQISILELGCGTGFITQALLKKFPNATIDCCDISSKMLDICEENCKQIPHNGTLTFHTMDINNELPKGKYDLICSSLSFQWIDELNQLIERLKQQLNPNGKLLFTTLLNQTFRPLQDAFLYFNTPYPGPKFLSEGELKKIIELNFNVSKIDIEHKEVTFETPLHFLKQIQSIGTTSGTEAVTTVSTLRPILKKLSHQYHGKTFSVSYHLALVTAQLEENK
jgi:malonyl-CoA O-methyltransferase